MTAILLLTVEHEGKGEDYIVPIGDPPCGKGKEVACLGGSWVIMVLSSISKNVSLGKTTISTICFFSLPTV